MVLGGGLGCSVERDITFFYLFTPQHFLSTYYYYRGKGARLGSKNALTIQVLCNYSRTKGKGKGFPFRMIARGGGRDEWVFGDDILLLPPILYNRYSW